MQKYNFNILLTLLHKWGPPINNVYSRQVWGLHIPFTMMHVDELQRYTVLTNGTICYLGCSWLQRKDRANSQLWK